MVTEYNREKLMEAAGFLPRQLRWAIGNLSPELQSGVEEIRLRSGRTMTVVVAGEERSTGAMVTGADLELTLENFLVAGVMGGRYHLQYAHCIPAGAGKDHLASGPCPLSF